MSHTRAAYHYAVRDIKNTENIVRRKFAETVLQNSDRESVTNCVRKFMRYRGTGLTAASLWMTIILTVTLLI
jgi:hypothetical protein